MKGLEPRMAETQSSFPVSTQPRQNVWNHTNFVPRILPNSPHQVAPAFEERGNAAHWIWICVWGIGFKHLAM